MQYIQNKKEKLKEETESCMDNSFVRIFKIH